LEGATGAIWKCSADRDNVDYFTKLKVVENLVALLKNQVRLLPANGGGEAMAGGHSADGAGVTGCVQRIVAQPEAVLTNVAGALAALAVNPDSCKLIRTSGGVEPLVKLLTSMPPPPPLRYMRFSRLLSFHLCRYQRCPADQRHQGCGRRCPAQGKHGCHR
jgi:hypothetical protein